MLRLTILSAALFGVHAGNHSGNGTSNVTTAPATVAATTAAPATVAATTVAAATVAAGTVAATTGAAATFVATVTKAAVTKATVVATTAAATQAPVTHAATVDPRAGCGNDTTSANCTTTAAPVVKEKRVTTEVAVTMQLDLTGWSAEEKTATGNGIAFGIHDAACDGVASMWTKKSDCLTGSATLPGVSFDMAMAIDAKLVSSQPGCTSADCYGAPLPAGRLLAAEAIANKGKFAIVFQAAALEAAAALGTDPVAAAQTAITVAKTSGALAPAGVKLALASSFAKNHTASTLGAKASVVATAAAAATVTVSAPAIETVTVAPSAPATTTSNAFTAGAASAFVLIATALLF